MRTTLRCLRAIGTLLGIIRLANLSTAFPTDFLRGPQAIISNISQQISANLPVPDDAPVPKAGITVTLPLSQAISETFPRFQNTVSASPSASSSASRSISVTPSPSLTAFSPSPSPSGREAPSPSALPSTSTSPSPAPQISDNAPSTAPTSPPRSPSLSPPPRSTDLVVASGTTPSPLPINVPSLMQTPKSVISPSPETAMPSSIVAPSMQSSTGVLLSTSASAVPSLLTTPSLSVSTSTAPSVSTTPMPSASTIQAPSVSTTPTPSVFTTPTPSPSSPCRLDCRCESTGVLLGESSFDESELQKFGSELSSIYYASNFPSGPVFRSNWDPNLVSWDGSKLSFTVEKRSDGSLYGAELRTNSHWYGYGCVSACMKPIPVSGIITSLFTYTGNFDGIGGSAPNHNEIDIEFEGKDTTIVQFNYYTDDDGSTVQTNEHDHNLGFDASQSFNVYGFRWTPWGIEWEVNGQIVHQVQNNGGTTTPTVTSTTVQKVMANAWIVRESAEAFFGGAFDEASFSTASAEYRWIRYDKLDENGCCAISPSCP
ncbi:Beta-glucanase [Gracilariopsis chorda]|uniref:Beta-glucanase n=1 Tax=Gracilariopsis chorda TaxID=448386 RepID=A0A2V3IMC3_9FLOR|nr:Beta-glucanase [Gracilariopsis chorda]|eukprot:PXF43233.1 Beta-glucanase [Gracilariopsis chorda]